LYPLTMFEKIAFPTPGLSEAPMTAIDRGERKIFCELVDDIQQNKVERR
jgi:hypothetical protein